MSIWALVLAGVINGMPIAEIAGGFETEVACLKAAVEAEQTVKESLNSDVQAVGAGCVKVSVVGGKPL